MTIVQSTGGRANRGSSAGKRSRPCASIQIARFAAEHRDCVGFIGKRARIARDRIALETHEPHRVRIVADPAANDGFYPFMGEPLVKPVNQVEANLLRQSLNEAVSGGAAHNAHGVALNRHTRHVRESGH